MRKCPICNKKVKTEEDKNCIDLVAVYRAHISYAHFHVKCFAEMVVQSIGRLDLSVPCYRVTATNKVLESILDLLPKDL